MLTPHQINMQAVLREIFALHSKTKQIREELEASVERATTAYAPSSDFLARLKPDPLSPPNNAEIQLVYEHVLAHKEASNRLTALTQKLYNCSIDLREQEHAALAITESVLSGEDVRWQSPFLEPRLMRERHAANLTAKILRDAFVAANVELTTSLAEHFARIS